jgi:hypothetical protein
MRQAKDNLLELKGLQYLQNISLLMGGRSNVVACVCARISSSSLVGSGAEVSGAIEVTVDCWI